MSTPRTRRCVVVDLEHRRTRGRAARPAGRTGCVPASIEQRRTELDEHRELRASARSDRASRRARATRTPGRRSSPGRRTRSMTSSSATTSTSIALPAFVRGTRDCHRGWTARARASPRPASAPTTACRHVTLPYPFIRDVRRRAARSSRGRARRRRRVRATADVLREDHRVVADHRADVDGDVPRPEQTHHELRRVRLVVMGAEEQRVARIEPEQAAVHVDHAVFGGRHVGGASVVTAARPRSTRRSAWIPDRLLGSRL